MRQKGCENFEKPILTRLTKTNCEYFSYKVRKRLEFME